MQQLII